MVVMTGQLGLEQKTTVGVNSGLQYGQSDSRSLSRHTTWTLIFQLCILDNTFKHTWLAFIDAFQSESIVPHKNGVPLLCGTNKQNGKKNRNQQKLPSGNHTNSA